MLKTIFSLLFVFLFSSFQVAEAQRIEGALQICAKPWLYALEKITEKAPEANEYLKIFSESLYAEPYDDPKNGFSIRFFFTKRVKDQLIIVPFCKKDEAYSKFAKLGLIASFDEEQGIIFLDVVRRVPTVIRGLILLHEMRHARQLSLGFSPDGTSSYRQRREVDAYEFEFAALDRLALPSYGAALEEEVARIKAEYAKDKKSAPDINNKNLKKLFPDLAEGVEDRKVVAVVLFLRAHFRMYDEQYAAKDALLQKIKLMQSIGYK